VSVASVSAAPAQQGPPEIDDIGSLLVSGGSSVQAEFTLGGGGQLANPPLELSGGRTYVAAHLQHVGGHHAQRAMIVRSVGGENAGQVVRSGFDNELPSGRYTLTLLADGPATVKLNFAAAGEPRRLRPTRSVRSTLTTGSVPVPANQGAGRLVLRSAVGAAQHVMFFRSLTSSLRGGRVQECVVAAVTCSGEVIAVDSRTADFYEAPLRSAEPRPGSRNAVIMIDGVRNGPDVLHGAALAYKLR
jgi:hypothetical protein